jgi:CRP-like cAMP-binding protein
VGYLDAAVGVGGLFGAVLAPRLARSKRPRAVMAAIVAGSAAPLAALAVVHSPVLALLILGVEGVASLMLDVVATTLMQRVIPETRLVVVFTGEPAIELRRLTALDYLGEIGLLQRRPRTATVRALTDVAAFRVPGEDFLVGVGVAGGPSRALESRVAER